MKSVFHDANDAILEKKLLFFYIFYCIAYICNGNASHSREVKTFHAEKRH